MDDRTRDRALVLFGPCEDEPESTYEEDLTGVVLDDLEEEKEHE